MCTVCAGFTTYSADCVFGGDTNPSGEIFEGADFGDTAATAGSMSVGDTVIGALQTSNDVDWIAINLVQGQTYTIDLTGISLSDTFLRLYDVGSVNTSSGTIVALNDDGGPGFSSSLSYTAGATGTYYIDVQSFGNLYSGSYEVQVTSAMPLTEVFTTAQIADQLTSGYWGGTSRAWNTSGNDVVPGTNDGDGDGTNDNIITYDVSSLSAAYQDYARLAFQTWSDVADLEFLEVTTSADISFQDTDSGAYASSSSSSTSVNNLREITSSLINVSTSWEAVTGSAYTLQTFIHEVGHALGLGHAGNYNGNATYGTTTTADNNYLNDSWQASIMSYFSQSENTSVDASFAYLLTPMLADILAIQNLYGAATDTRSGDTVYGFNSNAGTLFDLDEFGIDSNDSLNRAMTLYDSGGIDTIDLSGTSLDNTVTLVAGSASSIVGETGNLFIAPDSVIENIIGGSGNDTFTGNDADNVFVGGLGNDSFTGGEGSDTVDYSDADFGAVSINLYTNSAGGSHATGDTLTGIENIIGTDRNDYMAGDFADNIFEGGGGNDYLTGRWGNDQISGGAGNDILFGGVDDDIIQGGDGNDAMQGGDGNDIMYGGTGNDVLLAGAGTDTLMGDLGSDRLHGGTGSDTVDYSAADFGAISINLYTGTAGGSFATGDTLLSIENVIGTDRNDYIAGDFSDNTFEGGLGNDYLTGRWGNDQIFGGIGNDILFGGIDNDMIQGGDGQDAMQGGDGNDIMLGGAGNDVLLGGAGVDRINGGTGNDRINAGADTDVFVFNALFGNDTIVGFENGIELIDMTDVPSARYDLSVSLNSSGYVVADFGLNGSITFEGITDTNLITADDFLFVVESFTLS